MSSNRTLALSAAMAALSLAGCATSQQGYAVSEPAAARLSTEQYPLTVVEEPAELLLAPRDKGLSQAQHDALLDFARQWRANSTTEVVIEAASSGGPRAHNTSHAAADLLSDQGVNVRIVGYDADPRAPVRLSFLVAEAAVYDCNRSWEQLTATYSNQASRNFGCTLSANRAAMIDNPADILRPRDETPVDATRRQTVLGKYRAGEVSTASKDDQGSVTVSKVVN